MAKFEFNRKAALLYAEMNGIKVKANADDDALIVAVRDWVGVQPDKCDCTHKIRDNDRMCWFCGGDVAPDGTDLGGYKVLAAEWKKQKGSAEPEEAEPPAPEEVVEEEPIADEPSEPELAGAGEAVEEQEEEAPKRGAKKKEKEMKKSSLSLVEVEEEVREPVRAAKGSDLTLAQRVEKIRVLSKQTGSSAWEIGKNLFEIQSNGLWKEMKRYETWEEFCKGELGFSRMTANNFIRISQKFDFEQCKRLGLFHLIALSDSRLSEKDRDKLYGKAEKMDSSEVKTAVQETVAKRREEAGIPEPEPKKKRTKSPYQSLVGSLVEGKFSREDPQRVVLQLDDLVAIELKVLKTKVSAKFISLQPGAETEAE